MTVSFDGCGSANEILDPMQLLLTAVEQRGDQAHLNSHSLSVDRADSAPSQPLTTEELIMYGEGFDMVHDDAHFWELIHEDAVETPSGKA
jgi:hypothetical protein